MTEPYVTVQLESSEINPQTGEPWRWCTNDYASRAQAYADRVNAGEMSYEGRPWPPTKAWIVKGKNKKKEAHEPSIPPEPGVPQNLPAFAAEGVNPNLLTRAEREEAP